MSSLPQGSLDLPKESLRSARQDDFYMGYVLDLTCASENTTLFHHHIDPNTADVFDRIIRHRKLIYIFDPTAPTI